ncbi:TonB-dependent receptor plug domain-containing protein [Cruoricaptor ignavus]|uniref:TonB-dependent receptor plug domain-containing protein n=1 Tax=Cruoricaptor ignavus TaxID=1118202 RepID=UPI00370DC825
MNIGKLHFFAAALLPCVSAAQERIIDTVQIIDRQLFSSEKTQRLFKISDEEISRNASNLSEVLRFQSPIYIKENGRGMSSSPSFRGTTAQQTAFLWNGISINSIFLGQGDINNLGLLSFDNLAVKPGGGSVIYGSGAIGGTVHLNNVLKYDEGWVGRLFLEYGSFSTVNSLAKISFGDEDFSVNFSAAYNESANDYEVSEKRFVMRNAAYRNTSFDFGAGKKLGGFNEVFWQTHFFDGEQNFPLPSETSTPTKYETYNFRTMLGWNFRNRKFTNQLATAFLEENFDYFSDSTQPKTSGGKGKTYLIKDDFNFLLTKKMALSFLGEFRKTEGEGFSSGISNPQRNSGNIAFLIKWNSLQNLYWEAGVKKEWVQQLETPLLYSSGLRWKAADFYTVKINASKNFRYPTFNDLYWQPGGNLDLKSEISHQAELTNEFLFGNFEISATPYYMDIQDLIQWVPTSVGYWSPQNVSRVKSFGLESQVFYQQSIGNQYFKASVIYSYSNSKNKETGRQLTYVPKHKATGNLDYSYKNFGVFLQGMFNGLTFTTTDESREEAINPYFVMNFGGFVKLMKKYQFGFKIHNLTNQVYQSVSEYYLPKRNYSINLNLTF